MTSQQSVVKVEFYELFSHCIQDLSFFKKESYCTTRVLPVSCVTFYIIIKVYVDNTIFFSTFEILACLNLASISACQMIQNVGNPQVHVVIFNCAKLRT